jgi:hypothetical protein
VVHAQVRRSAVAFRARIDRRIGEIQRLTAGADRRSSRRRHSIGTEGVPMPSIRCDDCRRLL